MENNLQRNNVELVPAQSVNQNSSVVTPQGSQQVVSMLINLMNVEDKKGLQDDLDPELMAKNTTEATKKLRDCGSEKDETRTSSLIGGTTESKNI